MTRANEIKKQTKLKENPERNEKNNQTTRKVELDYTKLIAPKLGNQ